MNDLNVAPYPGRHEVARLKGVPPNEDTVMEKLRKAPDAGWDPSELRKQYNEAATEKRAAEAALAAAPDEKVLSREEIGRHVDQLGDVAKALDTDRPEELTELYSSLRLSLMYHHQEQIVEVEVDPLADRVVKSRVRGATHTLTTRLDLAEDGTPGRSLA